VASSPFLNDKLFAFLSKLAKDPVPNIRFNVSKAIEQLYSKLNNSNKLRSVELLKEMAQDEKDFDVRYYAEKALKATGN
jgi:serine/threonine-protein phosphatase 2A regulatory subunit A